MFQESYVSKTTWAVIEELLVSNLKLSDVNTMLKFSFTIEIPLRPKDFFHFQIVIFNVSLELKLFRYQSEPPDIYAPKYDNWKWYL